MVFIAFGAIELHRPGDGDGFFGHAQFFQKGRHGLVLHHPRVHERENFAGQPGFFFPCSSAFWAHAAIDDSDRDAVFFGNAQPVWPELAFGQDNEGGVPCVENTLDLPGKIPTETGDQAVGRKAFFCLLESGWGGGGDTYSPIWVAGAKGLDDRHEEVDFAQADPVKPCQRGVVSFVSRWTCMAHEQPAVAIALASEGTPSQPR